MPLIFGTSDEALQDIVKFWDTSDVAVAVAWVTRGEWWDHDIDAVENLWPTLDTTDSIRDIVTVVEYSTTIRDLLTNKGWRTE